MLFLVLRTKSVRQLFRKPDHRSTEANLTLSVQTLTRHLPTTMIIRCTQKLLKELRVKPVESDVVSEAESWHANLLRIDRRKCVLFTHDTTLFSFLVPGLRRPDFDHFDVVFG